MEDIEILIEFKMKNQNKTTENAIEQVFKLGYYGIFGKGVNDKFILGVQLDATDEKKIISAFKCLKHNGKGAIEERSSWIEVHV